MSTPPRARHRGLPVAVIAACLGIAGLVSGAEPSPDVKKQCAADHSQAQSLKLDGKLIAARECLVACSAEECPAVLRKECSEMLPEIDRAIPSIVIVARTPTGDETSAVKVSIDGAPVLDRIDGKSLAIDPGVRKLRLELAGARPIERELMVREGDKARVVEFRFESTAPAASASSASASSSAPAPSAPSPHRPIPVAVYALGGAGIAAVGAFAVFALSGRSQENELRDRGCEPYCPKSETDEVKQKYLIGDIFLAVGLVSAGAATWLYLKRPEVKDESSSALRWTVGPTRGGAFTGLSGSF